MIEKAKEAYSKLASYKLAESYSQYGLSLCCDVVFLILITMGFMYGLDVKQQGNMKSIAEIATSLHLLLNLSDVMKTLVKLTVYFETFFRINLMPFLEVVSEKNFNHELAKGILSMHTWRNITFYSFQFDNVFEKE